MAKRNRRNPFQKALIPAAFVGLASIAGLGVALLLTRSGHLSTSAFMLCLLAAQILLGLALLILLAGMIRTLAGRKR